MNFVESKKEKMIRRTMSSAINLLLIASFIAAPTSIVLLPTPSFANPLPFPPAETAEILEGLRTGTLTATAVGNLKRMGKESLKNLVSVINRLNYRASLKGSTYRLVITGLLLTDDPSKFVVTVGVVNPEKPMEIREYNLGLFTEDRPRKKTSLQAPMDVVSE